MESSEADSSKQRVSELHQELVNQMKTKGCLVSQKVEDAFRAIPRHLFLPDQPLEEVYRDQAITTKAIDGQFVSSSSQPTMMAIMLEQLQLQPGHHVLEIGAGTGYNAALMAYIVGETGRIVTMDIDEDIVEGAREHLKVAGYERVQVICADGGLGYPAVAPYDRIVLTVNASDIAPAWWEQLKPDGRLLLPLTLRKPQVSAAFARVGDHLESVSLRSCGFVGLRGAFAEQNLYVRLRSAPGQLYLGLAESRTIEVQAINKLLDGPYRDLSVPLQLNMGELFSGLILWLALNESRFCELLALGPLAEQEIIPQLFASSGDVASRSTLGLLDNKGSLSLLIRGTDQTPTTPNAWPSFTLDIRSFGPDDALALRLKEQILAWDALGRPTEQRLSIRAYPQKVDYELEEHDVCIAKRWTNFVCHWSRA